MPPKTEFTTQVLPEQETCQAVQVQYPKRMDRLLTGTPLNPPPMYSKASLLGLPTELRLDIFKALFQGLVINVSDPSAVPNPVGHRILASICATCRTFLVEAKPLFYQLTTVSFFKPTCWRGLTVAVALSGTKGAPARYPEHDHFYAHQRREQLR
jgi:hypothetical protein